MNIKKVFSAFSYIPQKVDEKLYRGESVSSPIKLYKLKNYGVNQIIDLRNHTTFSFLEKFMCKILGINYNSVKYPRLNGNLPETDFFAGINNKILQNDGKTYIHCRHGRRRTSLCVAMYELLCTNKTKKQILENFYNGGFKNLCENTEKMKPHKFNRRIRIYNNFIKKYYPEEPELDYRI